VPIGLTIARACYTDTDIKMAVWLDYFVVILQNAVKTRWNVTTLAAVVVSVTVIMIAETGLTN